jgi:hypothetical protein
VTAAVDLMAVARARAELAALVAAHPELTSPAARARLGDALPDLMEPTMSKSLDPNHTPGKGPSKTIGVRLTPDLLAAVEVETARLRVLAPGTTFGLSDGVRSLILRALSAAPSQPVAAPSAPEEPPLVRAPSMPPRRATMPPARASVRPPPSMPPPRVPVDLVAAVAQVPEADAPTPYDAVRARYLAARSADPKAWSYRATGELAGMSREPVSDLANGRPVSPATLAAIAKILPPEHTSE